MSLAACGARSILAVAVVLGCLHSRAHAQGFELNRFHPPPLLNDGLGLAGADTPGHLQLDVQLYADYAHNPLVLDLATGDSYGVVTEQLALHAAVALGLSRRAAVFFGMPVNLMMLGDDPPAGILTRLPRPEGTGLGDAHVGARARLVGDSHSTWLFAVQASLFMPLASVNNDQRYSGDEGVSLDQKLLLQANLGRFRLRADIGLRVRRHVSLPAIRVGDEFTFGAGAEYAPGNRALRVLAELTGASFLNELGGKPQTPLDLLVGVKYLHPKGLAAGVGAGPGLTAGLGTPAWRVLVTLGLTASLKSLDADADGIVDTADACPNEKEDLDGFQDQDGCPDGDNDADGLQDTRDQCPNVAEDGDGVADQDGCPDLDDDRDGVPDADDRCPNEAVGSEPEPGRPGCPNRDHDNDNIADHNDACPDQPEDMDGFEDHDGCPDLDNDHDSVADALDRCPLEAGDASSAGCPLARLDAAAGLIRFEVPLGFGLGNDQLAPESVRVLQAVLQLLVTQPTISHVRVEAHVNGRGPAKRFMDLSKQRARAVGRWLISAGILADRLEAVGCGTKRPLEPSGSGSSNPINERIEFHVLDAAQSTPVGNGCEPSAL
jgi:outer membrane protein OmpA-like peptidoglycan-associated protein